MSRFFVDSLGDSDVVCAPGGVLFECAGGPEQLSTGLAHDAATIRYLTDDLPLQDRVSAWREYLSNFLIEIELKPDHPASGRDWATATVGTTVTLSKAFTGLASFTAQAGQTGLTTYGGRVGINYAIE
jgi:hypothetical protein